MLGPIYGDELHAKRIDSLANGAAGVLRSARLSIHAIGAAYAELAEIKPKHGIKQVDRFLSNPAFDVAELTAPWARYVIGAREEAVIALDWTDFDDDDHMTLAAYLVTSHGRATPLTWKTVNKRTLKGKQKKYEFDLVKRLADAVPDNVHVTLEGQHRQAPHALAAPPGHLLVRGDAQHARGLAAPAHRGLRPHRLSAPNLYEGVLRDLRGCVRIAGDRRSC